MMGLNPNELTVTAVDPIPFQKGKVVAAVYGSPNQKGTSSLDLTIEYPLEGPDKTVFSDTLYFNEAEMAMNPVDRKELIAKGRQKWINKTIQQTQALAAAAAAVGKTFTLSTEGGEALVGAVVGFSAKPDNEDPTQLTLGTLKYLNGTA